MNTMIGKTVELEGVSRHGKNRVNEHGKRWRVVTASKTTGLKFLVASLQTDDFRWVMPRNDPNFNVSIVD